MRRSVCRFWIFLVAMIFASDLNLGQLWKGRIAITLTVPSMFTSWKGASISGVTPIG